MKNRNYPCVHPCEGNEAPAAPENMVEIMTEVSCLTEEGLGLIRKVNRLMFTAAPETEGSNATARCFLEDLLKTRHDLRELNTELRKLSSLLGL